MAEPYKAMTPIFLYQKKRMLHTRLFKRIRKLKKGLLKSGTSIYKPKKSNVPEHQKALCARYGDTIVQLDQTEQRFLYHITTVLDRLEDKIEVVYDIGANRGFWAEAFSLYTGANVYAFEPLPSMVAELRKRQERYPLIQIQPVACGNEHARAVMYEDEHKVEASSILEMADISKLEFARSKVGQSHPVEIEIVRLDEWAQELCLPLPTLIKMDVQGYENRIIQGGLKTFRQTKYVWVELCFKQLYKGGSTFEVLYEILHGLGFQLIDCVELVRSHRNGQLIYMDGIFAS